MATAVDARRPTVGRWLDKKRRNARGTFPLISGGLALLVLALVLYPLGRVLLSVVVIDGRFTLEAFGAAAGQPGLIELLWNTVTVVGSGTLIAVAIGSSFAWLNERTDAEMRWATRILPIVPLLVPPIAGAIGWVLLAAPRSGFINGLLLRPALSSSGVELDEGPLDIFSWYGLTFVFILYLVPHVYLTASAALRNVDPALEEAARVSGSGPLTTLRRITLPSVKPAIAAGGLLALIYGFALFSVPAIIGSQARIEVLSVRIVNLMTTTFPPQLEIAMVLGLMMMLTIGLGWWAQVRILRKANFATIGGRGVRVARVQLGAWRWPARGLMIAYLVLTSILPLLALVIVSTQAFWSANIDLSVLSLDNYRRVIFESSFTRNALRNSVLLGVTGATAGMLLAAILSFFIQRNRHRAISHVVDGSTKLPGAVSNVVMGLAFVAALAGPPFSLHGTILILFLCYLVIYMPQATFNASSALAQVGSDLSEASMVSGASQARTFFGINLPLMVPGLLAGWTLLFVLMAGDITASAMLSGTRNPVVGFVILDLWSGGSFPRLAAIGTVISLLSSSVVLAALWVSKMRRFQGGRR